MTAKKAIVIGAGFAGMSCATHLAHRGFEVLVLEKNSMAGGRARKFEHEGFVFDMGPSWYWMPDVFDRYFEYFGRKVSDYYDLERLDPSYRIYFGERGEEFVDMPASIAGLKELFDRYEPGAGDQLQEFLDQAAYKYKVGINDLVYRPSRRITEFISPKLLFDVVRMDVFQSFYKHARKFFKHPRLLDMVEFPILFLGALPQNTPALYSLMNYADMALGTWYPKGGMHKIVEGMVKVAEEMGVKFIYNQEVKSFNYHKGHIQEVITSDGKFMADVVVGGADYHHIDQSILTEKYRNYSPEYWDKRTMAPSSLLFYLGVDKKIDNLLHHNLFFDEDFQIHSHEIYEEPKWPSKPLFYASAPSKTDPTVAPEGKENLFLLVPVAPNLEDTEEIREKYYHMIMDRLERYTGTNIRANVVYKRSYAHRDFMSDYHAFKGNAYGLANTLMQTAILKPSLKNKHIPNLYYTGQLTVPGPGVPPSLISGEVVAKEVDQDFKKVP
ncbi:MAG: phytoene desaturase [Cyclobacteriaceae bacterium]|nr:phytoene desaturase [Cyclobacteriaceae bacterium]MCH8514928.1 phytoene desaturase [Cyclobacteriaceae bacterium]